MKLSYRKLFLVFFIFLTSSFAFCAEKKLYVAVECVPVKQKASIYSKNISNLNYGTKVLVLQTKGDWIKVSLENEPDLSGWRIKSALTRKKIVDGVNHLDTDTKELALAGKGFSASLEKAYLKEHALNFKNIDLIESYSVTDAQLKEFVKEGQLYEE